jgi:hypothetical protein
MILSDIKLPRELEVDGSSEAIRKVLEARNIRLWPGGELSIPLITLGEPLKKVLQRASMNGHVRLGLEAISNKLKKEEKGIAHLREARSLPAGGRVSRLLLVSNDGAERFYRHIEKLLQTNMPRVLGCMLDMNSTRLGSFITDREKHVKVIMAEHKSVVAEILRVISIG